MTWGTKRSKTVEPGAVAQPRVVRSPTSPGAGEGMPAAQILADLVESLGELLLEIGDSAASRIHETAAEWARRVRTGMKSASADDDSRMPEHDWGNLRTFVINAREREQQSVGAIVADLRKTIQAVISGVTRSIAEEKAADEKVALSLNRLGDAVARNSIEELKLRASEAVSAIGEVITERRSRQAAQIRELDTQLKAMRGELTVAKEKMSKDVLTGLLNRRAFDAQINHLAQVGQDPTFRACLMMIDGDHFKRVNDTYGHPAGDAVLVALANCLTGCFKRQQDFVARYGGEEFAAIVRVDSADTAYALAQRALASIRSLTVQYRGSQIRATVSIGLTLLRNGESASAWIARADRALYEAKRAGRDCCVMVDDTVR